MPKIGECKLCKKQRDLQVSHAVGDSIFKKIFRANSGKAISITSGDEAIGFSSDSWAEYQLCLSCEKLLNLEYEMYSLGVLRGKNCKFAKSDLGLLFSGLNQHNLIMYFLSIYWRAANSGHPSYKNVVIHEDDNEYLQNAIFNNLKVPSGKFSIKLSRVVDLSVSEGFTAESLKGLIVSPFCRIYGGHKVNNISVCFMFEGFFIEIYIKRLKVKERKRHGILSKAKDRLFVPYLNLFDIKEVVELMVTGYGKHVDGNSRLKANKSRQKDANKTGASV